MASHDERWTIGQTRITSLVEAETPGVPVELFYPDAPADAVADATWMDPALGGPDGIVFRVQSFVVEHRDRTIVVDPCVGNGKHLAFPFWHQLETPWMAQFRAAGFDPDDVDMVIHTHLHEDHIGWDTHLVDGVWVPTFPNAQHVYVDVELDWAASEDMRKEQDPFAESIAPIIDAGLSWQVGPDAELGDGIRLLSTPGHTPGHASVEIQTGAELLVISGDVLHHQFQLARPDVAEVGDVDAAAARRTRTDFFDQQARSTNVVAGTHFGGAPVGPIEAHGAAWRWTALAGTPVSGG